MSEFEHTRVETTAGPLEVAAQAITDVGHLRTVNEDAIYATAPVFFVADGMGGHQYGDLASSQVCETFAELIPAGAPTSPAAILEAIDTANARIQHLITEADGPGAIAGTTLAGIALVEYAAQEDADPGTYWMIYNVGDSRVYTWTDHDLVQLTVDHSRVAQLVALGVISHEEALVHPERNVITRAVGSEPFVETDLWLMPAHGRQFFLICSDGLTKELSDGEIAAIVVEHRDGSLARELVDAALGAGGRDNISVVTVTSQLPAAKPARTS